MRWLLAGVVLVCASELAFAQTGRFRPEDRVVISDFSVVEAVAASESHVFAATPNGLIIYDRRFRRFEPPVTPLDGYPAARVLTALADPVDGSIGLGTPDGLAHYRSDMHMWDLLPLSGGVRDMLYDSADPFRGVFLRLATGWAFLPRGGVFPVRGVPLPPPGRRAGSLNVNDLMRRAPYADAMRALVLTDERLRTHRYTSAAAVPLADEIYLGTDGLGLMRLDPVVVRFERLPFGLLSSGVSAVVATRDGIWAGSDGRGRRAGITFSTPDLQRFMDIEGPPVTGFGGAAVHAILIRGRDVWAGTGRGLLRMDQQGDGDWLGTVNGLPSAEVLALAESGDAVYVGTSRGLALVGPGGHVERAGGYAGPVRAVAAVGDTVWLATNIGLGLMTQPDMGILVADEGRHELRRPIRALALAGDTLIVGADERILWRAPGDTWVVERAFGADLGGLVALAGDGGGVWILGRSGLAFLHFGTRATRTWVGPDLLPGEARGIAVSDDYLWIATEHGLVRLRKRAFLP